MSDATATWSQVEVERLARDFMGWRRDSAGDGWRDDRGTPHEWRLDVAARAFRVGWNPFTDAAADYDVLQRARDTWAACYRGDSQREPWYVFDQYVGRGCWYKVGEYARAVLAVLDSQETNR